MGREKRLWTTRIRRLCLGLILGLVFMPNASMAQLDCRAIGGSPFCSASWHGLSEFYHLVSASFSNVCTIHSAEDEANSCSHASFEIWISPQNVSPKDTFLALQSGKSILIFDETEFSSNLFNYIQNITKSDSSNALHLTLFPSTPKWYINGNAALPVFTIDGDWPEASGSKLQIAWNHPNPHMAVGMAPLYAYAFQPRDKDSSSGRLVVLRDDSLPLSLMLLTLDNRKWLSSIMHWLCPDATCSAALYAPETHPANAPLSRRDRISKDSFFENLQKQVKLFWVNNRRAFDAIPWQKVICVAVGGWTFIVFCIIVPLRRPRQKFQ